MYITRASIKNYKSFWESDEIVFKKGINIIIGKNNSGKTALLEALSLNYQDGKYHKSLNSLPSRESTSLRETEIALFVREYAPFIMWNLSYIYSPEYNSTKEKIREQKQKIPLDRNLISNLNDELDLNRSELLTVINKLADKEDIELCFIKHNGRYIYIGPSVLGRFEKSKHSSSSFLKIRKKENEFQVHEERKSVIPPTVFHNNDIRLNIYAFKAERLNISACPFGNNPQLKNNASNLAEVLNFLQSNNPKRFDTFNEYVNAVFPRIHRIAVRPKDGKDLEIITWVVNPDTERADLTIPLSESGTGVGQVLSMLYVIINSDKPKVMIIDEPQSFLHPSALRTLIEIFQIYDHHQYIISTHSPIVISSASPSTINLIKIEDHQSVVVPLDPKQTKSVEQSLREIGARLSDVFGQDAIIWVEGPTEEEAFKTIITKIIKEPLRGVSILSVAHTGDFDEKNTQRKKTIMKIYKKLSGTHSLLPPSLKFIFDKEDRTESELSDLRKLGEIAFTEKRLFENYLLDAECILIQINSIEEFTPYQIELKDIENWFDENKYEKRFWGTVQQDKNADNWKKMIHAAKLLEALYKDLSEGTIRYRKTKDSVELAKIVAVNKPSLFEDITLMLKEILDDYQKTIYLP